MEETMTYEKFYDVIKKETSGVLRVTIPSKMAQFAGFSEGDKVEIMIKKMVAPEASENEDS